MSESAMAPTTRPLDTAASASARRTARRSSAAGRIAILGLIVAWCILPVAYLASVSLKAKDDILTGDFFPHRLIWRNWPDAFDRLDLLKFIQNSVVAGGVSVLITLLLAIPATYAMVRHNTGGAVLHNVVLSTFIAPPVVAVLPLFFLLRRLELLNSVFGLALVYGLANIPVAVWLLDSFIRQVPREIEEAAWVDGSSMTGGLIRMVVPLIVPGIVATGIICFILSYNEFLFALFFLTTTDSQTLPVAISLFQGDRLVNYGQMAAASVAGILPVYVLALFFQRWLIKGLTQGAVK